jgi:hypothetical protein
LAHDHDRFSVIRYGKSVAIKENSPPSAAACNDRDDFAEISTAKSSRSRAFTAPEQVDGISRVGAPARRRPQAR